MNAVIERLGWMLIHSLWEGAIVWLLLQMALITLHKKSSKARYLAACLALAAAAVLPWMTFGAMDLSSRLRDGSARAVVHPDVVSAMQPAVTPRQFWPGEVLAPPVVKKDLIAALLPWLVWAWLAGVAVFAARLWISWRAVRLLGQMRLPPLPEEWQRRLAELCHVAGVPFVRAGETAAVLVPAVVGWLKPVILLPLGVLTRLPAGQVEAILLHELAHIRRHDFLVNLLQSVSDTLFFYHPALRSISRRIRHERELACDDLSVEWCRNPVAYAEALAGFEEFRSQALSMAVSGEGDLLARIRRLVFGVEPRQRTATAFAAAGFLAIAAYLASMFLAPLFASQWMTAKERVAAIQALEPPNLGESSDSFPRQTISISGTVKTEDGKPLPKHCDAAVYSHSPHSSAVSWVELNGNSFRCSIEKGRISLGIWANGYAPLFVEPPETKDGTIPSPSLMLKHGIPARVRVLTPDGKPLSGVTLVATIRGEPRFPSVRTEEVRTDDAGEAVMGEVAADTILSIHAEKTGWQTTGKRFMDWRPDRAAEWILQPAPFTRGTVIDRVTLRPVPNASILLASVRGPDPENSTTYDPTYAPVLGHGDGNGGFRLESLNRDYSYTVYVKAAGYQTTVFPVQSGDRDIKLALAPGLHVKGRILDPDGVLKAVKKPEIDCEVEFRPAPDGTVGCRFTQPLAVSGPEIPFIFNDLPPGPASFTVNGHWHKLTLDKSVDDFVIDLGSDRNPAGAASPSPMRSVEISLNAGKDRALSPGKLNVEYLVESNVETEKDLPVVDGMATALFPVPNRISVRPIHLTGYWFRPEDFDLPAGTGPFRKTIDLMPAGVIHGKVTAEPNLRGKSFLCMPVLIKAPPGLEEVALNSGGSTSQSEPADRYVTVPLPIGGVYSVLFEQGASFNVTPPVAIDAEHPIVNSDIHLKADSFLSGKFVDEANNPIGLEAVSIVYQPSGDGGFETAITATARDGTFTIPNINFDVPGYYQVEISRRRTASGSMHIDGHTPQPVTIVAGRKRE